MIMSTALQVALFSALMAFIALVACLIPIAFQMRRHLKHLVRSADHLQAKIEVVLRDSHELAENLNDLSLLANEQMADMGRVVHTLQHWTEQGNRFVNGINGGGDPPIFSIVQNLNGVCRGVTGFLKAWKQCIGKKTNNKGEETCLRTM